VNEERTPGLDAGYAASVEAEAQKWGDHLQVEAAGAMYAWLDHPLVRAHYLERALVDGEGWDQWLRRTLGGPAERSLHLGCGSALRSITTAACIDAPIATMPTNAQSTYERVRRRARGPAPNGSASSSAAARERPSRASNSLGSRIRRRP